MLCDEMIELISLYIDNVIDDNQKRKVEKHILECAQCNNYFIMINKIKNELNQLEDVELPQNFHNDAMQKLKNELKIDKTKNIKENKKFNFRMWGSIAAATTIALIGFNFAINNFNTATPEITQFKASAPLVRSATPDMGVDDMFNLESVIWYDADMTLNKDYFDDINYILAKFGVETDINGGYFEIYSDDFAAMKTEIESIHSNTILNFNEVKNDNTALYNQYKQELKEKKQILGELIIQNAEQSKIDNIHDSIAEIENLIIDLDSKNDYYMLNINFR